MDSEVMTFRAALHHVGKQGMVEFTIGGHKCSRPASVSQGLEDDHFSVEPDSEKALAWKANQVQAKRLKSTNVASHFTFTQLLDFTFTQLLASPLTLVFWFNHVC